jgi:hypothetical protein
MQLTKNGAFRTIKVIGNYIMADRDKINQYKSIKYAQESSDSKKEMKFFQMLRKEVEIGANGTSKYMIKRGPNKGRFV